MRWPPRSFVPLVIPLMLGACATVGPLPEAPEPKVPERFVSTGDLSEAAPKLDAWWTGFGDRELEALIDRALAQNLDIAAAAAALEEARAGQRAARADLFPTLDGFVEAGLAAILAGSGGGGATLAAGGDLAWDANLYGRTTRALQAAEAQRRAAVFTLADVARLTVSAVASEYVALRRAEARLALLETTLELQGRTLEIARSRFDAGLAPELDVDRAAADLAQTRAQKGQLEAAAKQAAFRLSVLAGAPPGGDETAVDATEKIPALALAPRLGVPADLVRNRPDVRAAEAALVAELARVGVETAELYPALSLPGELRAEASNVDRQVDTVTARLTAQLDVPLFDGGRREAERDAQLARAEVAARQLRARTLEALREVEGALVQLEALRVRRAELEEAVARSRSAYEQLDALYREGLAGFIDVLDAQRTLITSRESLVETEADLAEAQIALFTALGADLPADPDERLDTTPE